MTNLNIGRFITEDDLMLEHSEDESTDLPFQEWLNRFLQHGYMEKVSSHEYQIIK